LAICDTRDLQEYSEAFLYGYPMSDSEMQDPDVPGRSGDNLTEKQADCLLKAACNFQASAAQAREKCREMFRLAEREDDNTLRILVDGQIAMLETTLSDPIQSVNPSLSYQIGLVTELVPQIQTGG
jgi:hypothetical protein